MNISGCGYNKIHGPKVFNKSEEKWEKVEQSGKIYFTLALRNNNLDGHIHRRLFMQA
jgi:hypothetical protein